LGWTYGSVHEEEPHDGRRKVGSRRLEMHLPVRKPKPNLNEYRQRYLLSERLDNFDIVRERSTHIHHDVEEDLND
jgi:hypothetical protein